MRSQPAAIAELPPPAAGDDWTFLGADTRQLTHCYHDYPARMIPQVAGKLLDQFGSGARLLFDPYCGTGTSLVEGLVRGLTVVGTDLNPLARLISTAKTTPVPLVKIDREMRRMESIGGLADGEFIPPTGIRQPEFWFRPEVSAHLAALRQFIQSIAPRPVRQFFEVAFSETVRDCSNTRNEEFKLYRYDDARLEKFRPDVLAVMRGKLERNRQGAEEFNTVFDRPGGGGSASILDFDTVDGVPAEQIKPESVDIVVTSPPYGDSRTTVAYGQYSRLSAAWLGLDEPHSVDRRLMGGTAARIPQEFPSAALNDAIHMIEASAPDRAREVSAFYKDLLSSITNVATTVRPGGHACYVVGNRRVKDVVLPTDQAVADFFASVGFHHFATFHRNIPNKRMPLKNSPGNIAGETAATMSREYIVVMKKK
jgi:DNA modification methylase